MDEWDARDRPDPGSFGRPRNRFRISARRRKGRDQKRIVGLRAGVRHSAEAVDLGSWEYNMKLSNLCIPRLLTWLQLRIAVQF